MRIYCPLVRIQCTYVYHPSENLNKVLPYAMLKHCSCNLYSDAYAAYTKHTILVVPGIQDMIFDPPMPVIICS